MVSPVGSLHSDVVDGISSGESACWCGSRISSGNPALWCGNWNLQWHSCTVVEKLESPEASLYGDVITRVSVGV